MCNITTKLTVQVEKKNISLPLVKPDWDGFDDVV